jgi:hypothetical protein
MHYLARPEPFRLSACAGKPKTIWNGEGDAWVQQGVAATDTDDYWGRFRVSTVTPAVCANNEGHVEPGLVNGRSRTDKSCVTHTERECCAKPCRTTDLMGAACSPTGSQPHGSTFSRTCSPTASQPYVRLCSSIAAKQSYERTRSCASGGDLKPTGPLHSHSWPITG